MLDLYISTDGTKIYVYNLTDMLFPYLAVVSAYLGMAVGSSLCLGLLLVLIGYCIKLIRYNREQFEINFGPHAPKLLDQILTTFPALREQQEECSICWEQFKGDQVCRLTICYHLFHESCYQGWIKHKLICPYCYQKLDFQIIRDKAIILKLQKNNQFIQGLKNSSRLALNPVEKTAAVKLKENSISPTENSSLIIEMENRDNSQ